MRHIGWGVCFLLLLGIGHVVWALPPAPPAELQAVDTPNDAGNSVTLTWKLSADDATAVTAYRILRRQLPDGEFEALSEEGVPAGTDSYEDTSAERNVPYEYQILAVNAAEETAGSDVAQGQATGEWFHTGRRNLLIAVLLFSGIVVGSIQRASGGREMFVRPIAGLEAVDEAIGRATEMGLSILYVLGIGGVSSVATIAGMNILGHVARRTAEYETPLRVPCADPIVKNVSREKRSSRWDRHRARGAAFRTQRYGGRHGRGCSSRRWWRRC